MGDTPKRTEEEKRAAAKRKGFGSNPDKINRNGRPKGSRNKSKIIKAQLAADSYSVMAIECLKHIMNNDTKALGVKSITVGQMIKASSVILDKAISNEKDKLTESKAKAASGKVQSPVVPKVFTTASSS